MIPSQYHCARCLTAWFSEDPRCDDCGELGKRGQLMTQLRNTHDYSFDGRHSGFTQADADALFDLISPQVVRGDN